MSMSYPPSGSLGFCLGPMRKRFLLLSPSCLSGCVVESQWFRLLNVAVDVWIKLMARVKALHRLSVLMMMTPSGAIPLLGGFFDEPGLSPHHGRMSLGENLDPSWVEQRRHRCVASFLKALPLETLIRVVPLASRCVVTVRPEATCEVSLLGIPARSAGDFL